MAWSGFCLRRKLLKLAINPHADLDHEDVQLALSQAQQARGGERRAQRQPEAQSSTLRYADETGLHPDVQKLLEYP
jgi:hypothetical protein